MAFAPAEGNRPWPATRISVDALGSALDPATIWLFEDAVSDAKLERLDDEPLPKTLTELSRPILVWSNEAAGDVFVQPLDWLTPGGAYTLAARGLGKLASFVVMDAPELPEIALAWPPAGDRAGGQIVLCGSDVPGEPRTLALAPGEVPAVFAPNFGRLDGLPCALVRFDATGLEGQRIVLPPELEGYLVEPRALEIGVREAALVFPVCTVEEVELGPGCARAEDDRLVVRSADQPLLWRFDALVSGVDSPPIVAAAGKGEFVVRGLMPGTTTLVTGSVIATDGAEAPFAAELTTSPPRIRLVVNEVLANPAGPEPSSEWVELFNAGSTVVSVAGMWLRDSGGSVELPDVAIAPGEFALIVRSDFVQGPSDVPADVSAPRVVVQQLGKNGLANSGEPVALLDATGRVLSSFPAIPAAHAGVSVARTRPDALDTDGNAFAEHAAPGASPGMANEIAKE